MMSEWDIQSSFLTDEELRGRSLLLETYSEAPPLRWSGRQRVVHFLFTFYLWRCTSPLFLFPPEFGFADISQDGQNGTQQTQHIGEKNRIPAEELVGLNSTPRASGGDNNAPKVPWAQGDPRCLKEAIPPTNGFTNAIPTTLREQTTHANGLTRVIKSTIVAGKAAGSQAIKKKRSCRPNLDEKTPDKKTRKTTNSRKKGLIDSHSSGSAASRPFLVDEKNGLADIHNLPCINGEKAIVNGNGEKLRSSQFRGVTKHKRSGRWEAHIWVKETGKQMYLGGYDREEHAAEAYDVAAMKCKGGITGRKVKLNFPEAKYTELSAYMASVSLEELVMAIRRQSQGFARGSSGFRGVTQHPNGRWEARIGMPNSKHIYLGLYNEESAAARAYDMALVRLRGPGAATNYTLANYKDELKGFENEKAGIMQLDAKPSCKEEVKNEEA